MFQLLDAMSDCLAFGALDPCSECKDGQLVYTSVLLLTFHVIPYVNLESYILGGVRVASYKVSCVPLTS